MTTQTVNTNGHSIAELRELLYELINYSTDRAKEFEQYKEEQRRQEKALKAQGKEVWRQLGELTHKMGTLVESFVEPDMPRILRKLTNLPDTAPILVNVRVKRFHPNRATNGQRRQMVEIDAIAESDDFILMVEAKNTMRSEYVTKFVETLADVRTYFPEYHDRPIIGAVGSLKMDEDVALYAMRQGLVVLALGDGLMTIKNEPDFQWKAF